MTDDPDIFTKAEAGLRDALAELTTKLTDAGADADPPDKTARAISAILKSLDDLAGHRERAEAKAHAQKYTRYEDLPPPSPEDEARFYETFKNIFDYVVEADAAGLDLSLDADAPKAMARSHLAVDGKAGSKRTG